MPFAGIDDAEVFEAWKRQAIEFVHTVPSNDWEWLSIAQHHGLATRLRDWSNNPLFACFFAVRDGVNTDAAIIAVRFKWKVLPEEGHPLLYKKIAILRPHRVVPRIARQGGTFSIHPKPAEPLTETSRAVVEMQKIVIPASAKDLIKRELSFYGVNALALFPDLDGLAEFTNWTIESKEYWKPF